MKPIFITVTSVPTSRHHHRRGVTLLESLIAVGLLVVVVTAVLGAMDVGRLQSDEGRRLTMSSLAAEMLLARVADVQDDDITAADQWYDHFLHQADQGGWNDHSESAGTIRAGRDTNVPVLPEDYQHFNLHVTTGTMTHRIPPPMAAEIEGVHIQVRAEASNGRALTTIERFVPLPQHLAETMP